MAQVGLQVVEGVASGLTPFIEASKHNIGLLMERKRGVPRKVVRITSLQEDRKIFGDPIANSYGAYVTRHIYNNAGQFGAVIYGARILDELASVVASAVLTDGAPSTQTLTQLQTQAAVAKVITHTLTGTNGTADIDINGNTYTATFNTSLIQTAADFVTTHAAAILATEGVVVTSSGADIILTAQQAGRDFTSPDGINLTGDLDSTAVVTTANVEKIANVIPSNVSVGDSFSIQVGATTLTFVATAPTVANVVAGLVAAINAELTGNPTGDFGTGLANITNVSDEGTHVELTSASVTYTLTTLNGAANNIIRFWAGQLGQKDPGDWGNDLSVKVYPIGHVNGLANAYLLEVFLKNVLVETLSATTWANLISTVNQLSYYVYAESLSLIHDITDIQTVTLTGGVYTAPVEADFYPVPSTTNPEGLAVLDGYDVQLVANTEHHSLTMAQQGRDYCASRGDCMYVANLPYLANDATVETFANGLQEDGPSFIAGYNFWVKTNDENGSFTWIPGLGVALGAGYIRVPQLNRDNIWIPPGGIESAFKDVQDIVPNPLSQATVDLYVQRYTTNVAVFRQGKGFFLFSSRTYATNPLYHSVHIRRMTSFLVTTLRNNLLFTLQKPNAPQLRRDIVVTISQYFRGIYNDGGLERTVPFEEAVQVICDKTNNPATQDRKLLNVDVNWIPVECTESVRVRLNRNDGILIASEI